MKKKRLLSLLLSFCLVVGLFAAMTATAYADGDTWVYEVKSGDYLSLICSKNGIDYAKNQEWIIKTNNLKNPNVLSVGQQLKLPVKGAVLKWVEPAATTTTTTTTGTTATDYTVGGGVTGTTATTTTTTTGTFSVPTVSYTLKNGDFVSAVCQKLKIDFAKNDAWIRAANNITSYNNLKVGRVIILPAPGTTPALSTAGTGAAATTTAATTVATTTTSAVGLLAGDTVSYYMYTYIVKSGDTLFNICNSVGANMDTVQKLNNITNPAALRVGQALSIPSTVVPSSGSYTKIVAHKVVSGDTVQAICKTYGVDYGKTAAQIKALNNRDNLDAIKVGQTLLIPVSGTGTGASQSGTSSGSSVITSGATGTAYYTLNKTGAVGGTYALTVNGQSINGASAGQVVHVVVTPDHGNKLSSIQVTRAYNGTAIQVDNNNNFVMPACNVQVSVSFTTDPNAVAHPIAKSNVCGAVNLTYVVGGYANTKAEPGQTVSVIIGTMTNGMTLAEAGKVIDKVYVTTVNPTSVKSLTDGSIDPKNYVSVSSNLSFAMPTANVYVTILLKDA